MPSAPIPETLRAAAPAVAERFAWIVAGLARVIARGFLRHPTRAALILPLCLWLQRTRDRFNRLAARAAAGRLPRPSRPRRAAPRAAAPRTTPRLALPRRSGWLLRELGDIRHEAAFFRNQLERLLDTGEARALLEAIPTAGRLLRPLCHMLALKPALLEKPKPPRPAPPNPDPPRAPGPPPRPAMPGPPCPRLALRWPWAAIRASKPA
jgi:hypothetical protein